MNATMSSTSAAPRAHTEALSRLAESVRTAHALADVLDYIAGLLRGGRTDPEGPTLEGFPGRPACAACWRTGKQPWTGPRRSGGG
jgi:hypothetical protein